MTEWTPEEEEAVARAMATEDYGDHMHEGRRSADQPENWSAYLHLARAAIAAMQQRWRDVRTDPPPRDGTDVLLFRRGKFRVILPAIVAGWFDKGVFPGWYTYDEPDKTFYGEVTHWQPITPPLPTAPEDSNGK